MKAYYPEWFTSTETSKWLLFSKTASAAPVIQGTCIQLTPRARSGWMYVK